MGAWWWNACARVARQSSSPTLHGQGTTHFRSGDNFTVILHGAANSPVTVTQTFNGVPGTPYTFGNTNGSGDYSVPGSWGSGNVGSYIQYWTVGGVPAMPTQIFTVYAN